LLWIIFLHYFFDRLKLLFPVMFIVIWVWLYRVFIKNPLWWIPLPIYNISSIYTTSYWQRGLIHSIDIPWLIWNTLINFVNIWINFLLSPLLIAIIHRINTIRSLLIINLPYHDSIFSCCSLLFKKFVWFVFEFV
jgi:hypothetical protein